MKKIPLNHGKFAMVDDADYEAVSQFTWHAKRARHKFCAARKIILSTGKPTTQRLHQFLLPGVPRIDHRDGDGLNNQRENLRPATHTQNQQGHRHKWAGATSQYRGVSWTRKYRVWVASIKANRKKIHIGHFHNEIDAAKAYDSAARKYFGEFASPNFP